MAVSREDVIGAYRYILGREPESEEIVSHFVNSCYDFDHLRITFLLSAEAKQQMQTHERQMKLTNLADRFTDVYVYKTWGDAESVSGAGSYRSSSGVKRSLDALQVVCRQFKISSMNDIPCGDFNWIWMFLDAAPHIKYAGFDIVAPLIDRNKELHPVRSFYCLDITSEVPPSADLIFCKDLFNHLAYDDIAKALTNMKKSGIKWLLASNTPSVANAELTQNYGGGSRYFNLCGSPINFPPPIWSNGYIELWELGTIDFDGD